MKWLSKRKYFAYGTGILLIVILVIVFLSHFNAWLPRITNSCYRCNVIVIAMDPLPAGELPCFGYHKNTMPNLCRFANQNMTFTNMYSQTSWTMPNVFSLLTGTYPYAHAVQQPLYDTLSPDYPTLAQILQKAGYHTSYIGPTDQVHIPLDKGLGRGFEHTVPYQGVSDWTDAVKALTHKKDTPQFLFLHSFEPHATLSQLNEKNPDSVFYPGITRPFELTSPRFTPNLWQDTRVYTQDHENFVPQETSDILKNIVQATSFPEAEKLFYTLPHNIQYIIAKYDENNIIDVKNTAHLRYLRDIYDNVLYDLDRKLTPLFEALEQVKQENKTIIIITSNHGTEFGEHGVIGHDTNLYAIPTRVPLIISLPKLEPQRVSSLVQSIDIYPTILDLVGISHPASIQGLSTVPVIQNKKNNKENRYVFGQLGPVRNITSIRSHLWSYYLDTTQPETKEELYNLTDDPQEQHNVLADFPDVGTTLKRVLEKKTKETKTQTNHDDHIR
jgi:arylsulfatase A-like enzyme